jgi:two-component system, sensor histidine kinase and response regulator
MSEAPQSEPIAVIDDDYAMRLSCRKILAKAGYRVEVFENGAQGLEGVARCKPGLVVVDLKMPGISGMEVVSRVHELEPNTTIVVITGYATIDTAVEAMKCGAYDFLPKPFSPDELRIIVSRGLERRKLALETRRCEVERELMRHRFVTFVSHQLQTPLAAVHQYLDVLQRLEDSPGAAQKRQEWFDRCLKRTEEMQTLIRNWLTLARVEGHRLVGERTRVDLNRILPNILATCADLAAENSVTLDACLLPDPCPVAGEVGCLTALFDNLIVNAIKYNRPGGRVTVSAAQGTGEVIVSVADTGIGIPPECRRRLFDEFFRVEGAGANKTTGSGLGLAICRRIVSELGGSIAVESEVGSGSTFTVRLLAWRDGPNAV